MEPITLKLINKLPNRFRRRSLRRRKLLMVKEILQIARKYEGREITENLRDEMRAEIHAYLQRTFTQTYTLTIGA